MIPSSEYKATESGITGVTFAQVKEAHTEEEYERFCEWMSGQTCTALPDGQLLNYSWDYERWIAEGMQDGQLPHNWD